MRVRPSLALPLLLAGFVAVVWFLGPLAGSASADEAAQVTQPTLTPPWAEPSTAAPRLATEAQRLRENDDDDEADEEDKETLLLEEEPPYEAPMPAATLWTLFAWELGFDSDFEEGVVFELGAELGLPWRTTGVHEDYGIIPALSASFAGGFRGYTYRDSPFQSWSVSVNAMTGLGVEYPAGTLLFGPMLRWELAFRPLRTAPGGTPMIGANGVHSFSVGAYVRFMIFDDRLPIPLPIGIYVTTDLNNAARREITVAVDLGGLIVLGALFGR